MDLSCNLGNPVWQQAYGRDGGVDFARQQDQCRVIIAVPPCGCPRCGEQWLSWRDQTGFGTVEEVLQAEKRGIQPSNFPRRRYSRVLDNYEAAKLLADKLSSINEDREYLSSAVHQQGNMILSRWRKQRITGRTKVLKHILPAIVHRRWLCERVMGHEGSNTAFEDFVKSSKFCLIPALSMDELAQDPQCLVHLIHARTVWTPEQWVAVDRSSTAWAWWNTRHPLSFNPASVCLSGPSYGQLVPLDMSSNHGWKMSGFPRAFMILETQAHLLRILSQIVERLLEEPACALGHDKWLESFSQPFRRCGPLEASSPFLRQLYSEPPQQDPVRMMHIAKVRLDAHADTIWLMQTEAAYFNRWLTVKLPKSKSLARGLCQTGKHGEYNRKIHNIVTLVQNAARWKELHEQYVALGYNLKKMGTTQSHMSTSQGQLQRDMQDLDDLLVRDMLEKMAALCTTLMPLRADYTTTMQIDLCPGSDGAVFAKESPLAFALEEMIRLSDVDAMVHSEVFESSSARAICLLEHFLLSTKDFSKGHQGRVELVSIVADMLALYSIRICLRAHTSGILPDSMRWNREPAEDLTSQHSCTGLPKYGDQLACRLRHFELLPIPGPRRDHEWLSRTGAQVQALREFWTSFEDAFRCPSDQDSPFTICAKALLGAHREPAHVANLEAERQAVIDRLHREHQDRLGITPVQTQWGDESASTLTAEYKRSKKRRKARPSEDQHQSAKTETPDQLIHDLSLAEQRPPNPIEVPRESLLTLQRLFTSSAEDTRGPVHWQSFKKAMGDAGFLVAHRGGSAVEFAKEDQGRISVHRPHPEDKLDNIMLLSIGKRMTRHFGWTRDTFVERSKAASSDKEAALRVSGT